MRDPFLRPPALLVRAAEPLSQSLALKTLPLHVHEILPAFCIYEFINRIVSPYVSARLAPQIYPQLSRKTKINWNVHFVSMVQSCFINTLALWVICVDRERMQMSWKERVWGYTGAGGMVQGFAAGYFAWDLLASSLDIDVHGWGALAHAASALTVSMMGFVRSWRGIDGDPGMANLAAATFCQLLRSQLHSIRTFNSVPEHPLVAGQGWHDWQYPPASQRYRSPDDIRWQSLGLGHISKLSDVHRHLACYPESRRASRAVMARNSISRKHHCVEWLELLLVWKHGADCCQTVRKAE